MIGRLQNFKDTGLLILRIGLGGMYLWHGWPKLSGGPERWTKLGGAMGTDLSAAAAKWAIGCPW